MRVDWLMNMRLLTSGLLSYRVPATRCSVPKFKLLVALPMLVGLGLPVVSQAQSPQRTASSVNSPSAAQGATSPMKTGIAPAPKPMTPPVYLGILESTNRFDRDGKMWPDRAPPPAPPPLPPPPAPVTDQDMQLYGVVIVGHTKRATVKVGSRFARLAVPGRAFVTLTEGQSLGEFTLSEIQANQLVLSAPGGKQMVGFTKKTDRLSSPPAPIAQAISSPANDAAVASTAASAGSVPSASQGESVAANQTAGSKVGVGPGATVAVNSAVAPAVDNALRNAQPGSLAAAIAAAQAAAQSAPPSQNPPPPANFNPFLQMFPKQ